MVRGRFFYGRRGGQKYATRGELSGGFFYCGDMRKNACL
jgi:hypothetical protein